MNGQREWTKTDGSTFLLSVNGQPMGQLTLHVSDGSATALVSGKMYAIKHVGFWKSRLVITDESGEEQLRAYPEKWYANSLIVDVGQERYSLIIWNNPMAEWKIIDQNRKLVLAYGLSVEQGLPITRITSSTHPPVLFDFLLWYLFYPVIQENAGDAYRFTTQITSEV
ncbi:hypothetical protein [Spirosoma areae]